MATSRRVLAVSAGQLDPLSWFTGPFVPVAFTAVGAAFGLVTVVAKWGATSAPLAQVLALALAVGAGVAVHILTRPLRQQPGWLAVGGVMTTAVAALTVSALGYVGSSFTVELWWAPVSVALTTASLGPYIPIRRLALVGLVSVVVAAGVGVGILGAVSPWGRVATATLIAYPLLLGLSATVAFCYGVVSRMLRLVDTPARMMPQVVQDEAAQNVERAMVARLTARAVPFLESVADAGRITPSDRALAGQLARRLRDELVTQSNLSWLDSIASRSRLVVVDPDRRARRMNSAQRTALRGILQAILDTPGTDSGSLMIELRAADDGATAVGLSLDMALPEGRRIMHLAPYYLNLRSAVDDLSWDREALLRLSFRVADDPTRSP